MRASVLLAVLLAPAPAAAGTLSTFEKAAGRPEAPRRHERSSSDTNEGGFGAIVEPAVLAMAYGGSVSAARQTGRGSDSDVTPRDPGEALIPLARAESSYQWVRGGVSAVETRVEAGWAFIALQADYTSYWDRRSRETLSATTVGPLYRMSFGDHLEVDLGVGAYSLNGEKNRAGTSFTLPVRIEPSRYWGVEFRPSWHALEGVTVRDHEAALRLGARWASLRGGYRWVDAAGATLSGPFVGAMLVW